MQCKIQIHIDANVVSVRQYDVKMWNDVILHFALKEEVAPQDNLFSYLLKHSAELIEGHLLHFAATDGCGPDDVDLVALALLIATHGLE